MFSDLHHPSRFRFLRCMVVFAFLGQALALAASGPSLPCKTLTLRRSPNAYGNQYFHANSAIPMKVGTGQYRNVLVSWNSVSYAASKRVMIGGGIDLYSTINAARLSPVWTARLQYCGPLSEHAHLGGTVFYLDLPLPKDPEALAAVDARGLAAAQAQFTWGDPDDQLTVAAGLAQVMSTDEQRPILTVSGAKRVFANVQLITEHWALLSDGDRLFTHSLGLRVVGDHLAIDGGVLYNERLRERTFSWGLPFIAATLNF
jgi:hypothetical protein